MNAREVGYAVPVAGDNAEAIGARISATLTHPGLVHRETLPNGQQLTANLTHVVGTATGWVHVRTPLTTRVCVQRWDSKVIDTVGTQPLHVPGYREVGAQVRAVEPDWAFRLLGDPAVAQRLWTLFQSYPGDINVVLRPGQMSCALQSGDHKLHPSLWPLMVDAVLATLSTASQLPAPSIQVKPTARERLADDTKIVALLMAVLVILAVVGAGFGMLKFSGVLG